MEENLASGPTPSDFPTDGGLKENGQWGARAPAQAFFSKKSPNRHPRPRNPAARPPLEYPFYTYKEPGPPGPGTGNRGLPRPFFSLSKSRFRESDRIPNQGILWILKKSNRSST